MRLLGWTQADATDALTEAGHFFLTFYFILKYSLLTMLWLFQVDCKGTQPHIYLGNLDTGPHTEKTPCEHKYGRLQAKERRMR